MGAFSVIVEVILRAYSYLICRDLSTVISSILSDSSELMIPSLLNYILQDLAAISVL